MRVLTLLVALAGLLAPAVAAAQDTDTDTDVDCNALDFRCTPGCQCEARMDIEPCNSLPDGLVSIAYPTDDDPVQVLCPTVIMSGAHDPETLLSDVFYRIEVSTAAGFDPLVYDSGMVAANPGVPTNWKIQPNVMYPNPIQGGNAYWMRVTDNDNCSDVGSGTYYSGPNPGMVYFSVTADAQNNCQGGDVDADTDGDMDIDTDGDGDGGGGSACGGCATRGRPDSGALVLFAAFLAFAIASRRR